jgi:putative PIN family toxin of toxin-antitoxin system
MNIVLDTNVLVAAFRSQTGASFRVLELAFTTELFQPQFSIPVLSEYESKLLERTNASSETVDNFLNSLLRRGKHHVIYFLFRGFLKDKNDDMLLELALKSRSSYIVTHNIKDFNGIRSFGITAITPKDFLNILKNKLP